MSTILLPAIRRPSVNLIPPSRAGVVAQGTGNTLNWFSGSASEYPRLREMGLAVGDIISASLDVSSVVPEAVACRLFFWDSVGSPFSATSGTGVTSATFARAVVQNVTIPANTEFVSVGGDLIGNTGTSHSVRRGMINRGSTAATHVYPRLGAAAPLAQVGFGMLGEQVPLPTTAGVTQITSFPSRLWRLRFTTIEFETTSDEFREWELALNQLSDLTNVFRFVPPDYRGPSTGYAGANPVVNGGSQLGTSLVCDGVTGDSAIVKRGDYASFEVTSPKGTTNVQLFKIAADATSDGSGDVLLTFTKPIRQAPVDDAVVQIFSPTAQFRFVQPQYETASDSDDFAAFSVDAIEQVYP